ncbi:MAG: M3 family metallopeptidase [Myxococcota bacterium]
MAENPLTAPWTGPHALPPFAQIEVTHFEPAFEEALRTHRNEIAVILSDSSPPTFENTVEAIERSGSLLARVEGVFWNLESANTTPALQAVRTRIAPVLALHHHRLQSSAPLYERVSKIDIDSLHGEEQRVTKLLLQRMERAGAALDEAKRERVGAIQERLASLYSTFGEHLLADEADWALPLTEPSMRAGLPDSLVAACRAAGDERGSEHPVLTLSRSMVMPFLESSERRDLRQTVYEAWSRRGETPSRDNRPILNEIVAVRRELAGLFNYESYAEYALAPGMAKTPDSVRQLFDEVWHPARKRAEAERDALARLAAEDGIEVFEPWDWRFYAARHRVAQGLDVADARAYLSLESVRAAAFACAERLFGVRFEPTPELPAYHPDVAPYEVRRGDDVVGVFYGDYFARPSKRSGAWMSEYRVQHKLDGDVRPVVVNVLNFNPPKRAGDEVEPALLSMDDARTLFHELGHALHGLLSDVRFPSIGCTRVAQDFVELPSQLFEHWLEQPEILDEFARHYQTGEAMPERLREDIITARNLDQGFQTVEYVASAAVDLEIHDARQGEVADLEKATLGRLEMPREIEMRHRVPHFQHLFAGADYAGQYYSYLWANVLDADAFEAFREAGDLFDSVVKAKLHDFIYSAGGKRPPEDSYVAFRGRLPTTDALLRRRGLV